MSKLDYGAVYRELHRANPKWFKGTTALRYTEPLKALVGSMRPKPKLVLDYGSGRGQQYLVHRLHELVGMPLPYCYDPGVPGMDTIPDAVFDLVVCTDVLEHIEEQDVAAVIDELAVHTKPKGLIFCAIACRPAGRRKRLPDGRNVHLTVKPPAWWRQKFNDVAPNRSVVLEFDERSEGEL